MRDYMRCVRFDCHDCGHDTRLMCELYMVTERLWDELMAGTGVHMICIGCLEQRLGRRLGHEDFINCPLNYEDFGRHSLRLRHRLVTSSAVVA